MLTRRSIITGLVGLIAAPAIVRAGLIMPVKVMKPLPKPWTGTIDFYRVPLVYGEIVDTTMNGYPLYKSDGSILQGCDILSGQLVSVIFDGARWVVP